MELNKETIGEVTSVSLNITDIKEKGVPVGL